MARSTILFALLTLAASAGCSGPVEPAAPDEGNVAEAEQELAFGDTYAVKRDARKCMSPWCGGYFVRALNHPLTRCADGTVAPECYAAVADFGALQLDPPAQAAFEDALVSGHAVVRATLHAGVGPGLYGLAMLYVREGWRAATRATPTGTFFQVVGVERGCADLVAPCTTALQVEVNSGAERLVSYVDLAGSGAGPRQLALALRELRTDGLMVAGHDVFAAGPPVAAPRIALVASQYYERVRPRYGAIPCAGFIGRACPTWLGCDITIANACNGADLPGECKPVPVACLDVSRPVCGCDGETYENDCVRRMAGAQLDHDGACAKGG